MCDAHDMNLASVLYAVLSSMRLQDLESNIHVNADTQLLVKCGTKVDRLWL